MTAALLERETPTETLDTPLPVSGPIFFRGLSVAQVDRFEKRLEELTSAALRRVMRQVTAKLGKVTTAALIAADVGAVSPDDLAGITPLWQRQVVDELMPVVAEIYRGSSGQLHTELVDAVGDLPPTAPLAADAYLAQARNSFTQVGGELWENARNELLDGMQAGESVPQLAARLRTAAPELTDRQARLVARTQVNDAANAGSLATARASGLDLLKAWEATPDLRTREEHLMAASTYSGPGMIGLEEPFMVGGWPCQRPHDPELPPEMRYNCRCTLLYQMRVAVPAAGEQVISELEAAHQQRLALLAQRHAQRLALLNARHRARLEALSKKKGAAAGAAEKATAAHEQQLARLRLAHEQRLAKLAAEHQRRLAIARGGGEPPPLASRPVPSPLTGDKAIQSVKIKYRMDTGELQGLIDTASVARVSDALRYYRGIGFADLNRILRGTIDRLPTALERSTIDAIDEAMAISTLERDITVFRGLRNPTGIFGSRWAQADLTGVEWDELGLSSTAPTLARVEGYARHAEGGLVLRLRVPAGTGAVDISSTGSGLESSEVVLARGLRFRVVADRGVVDGVRQLDVEVVRPAAAGPLAMAAPRPLQPPVLITGQPTLVPVRASLMQAQTVDEVRKAFLAEWSAILRDNGLVGAPQGRFWKLSDVQTAREHAEGVLRGIERFPQLPVAVSHKVMGGTTYAHADEYVIRFNNYWAQRRDDYLESLRLAGSANSQGVPWHPMSISSPQGIAAHEFGHVLHRALTPLVPDSTSGILVFRFDTKIVDEVRQIVAKMATDRGVDYRDLVRVEIGGYATQTPDELIAEAFADALVNGEAASPLSRQIFQLLVDGYDEMMQRLALLEQRANPAAGRRIAAPGPGRLATTAAPSDGLDLLELHSLRNLAIEFEIPNASKLTKARAVAALRQLGVVSPEVARQRLLRSAIAETIDLIDKGKDRAAVFKLLRTSYGGSDALDQAEKIAGLPALKRSLQQLAKKKGITLPDTAELKMIQAARRKAEREVALKVRAEKLAAAEIKKKVKALEQGDFTHLVRVGPQAGSNPGGVFEDAAGNRWYVKEASEEWAREQALAAALYNVALRDPLFVDRIATPPLVVGRGTPGLGRWQVAARIVEGTEDLEERLTTVLGTPEYFGQIRRGFAVDAWLGNWDVAGATFDNIITTSAGVPIRVDVGGSLRFRAQGAPKGSAFGREVREWGTLRDPAVSLTGSQLFAGMSRQQLIEAVARVKAITPAKIQALVKQYGVSPKLAELLIERRADLLARAASELDLTADFRALLSGALRGNKALNSTLVQLSFRTNVLTGILDPQGSIRSALESYRGLYYKYINGALRGDVSARKVALRYIGDIDDALDHSPLPTQILGYRMLETGQSIFGQDVRLVSDLAGREWWEHGYTSMSISKAKADEFAMSMLGGSFGWIRLRVVVPKGINGVQLSDASYEAEILLDRDLKFKVVADHGEDKQGIRNLDVLVVTRKPQRMPL